MYSESVSINLSVRADYRVGILDKDRAECYYTNVIVLPIDG